MKTVTFKYSLYGLIGIIGFVFIFVFSCSSLRKKESYRKPYAVKIAEKMLFESKKNIENRRDFGRRLEFPKTSTAVYTHGAISIVKDSDFEGVNEKPKSLMERMRDMARVRKDKMSSIQLDEKDFEKKIFISTTVMKQSVKGSKVPGLGEDEQASKLTMITAPVDYKLFKSDKTWKAFASSQKGNFPNIDFEKENVVILVSVSDFPSGIFKIVDTIKESKEIIIKYRVNPLIMSSDHKPDTHDHYTAFSISKADLPIRLVQIP